MTNNERLNLKRQEAALTRELKRRDAMSATARQIAAAKAHDVEQPEPEYEEDRSRWSTTELQVFGRTGRKPLRREAD